MSSKYKIGIWGQFGNGGRIADGQAVRTTIITNELKLRYGEDKICVANTNNWKRHPFSFFCKTIGLLKKAEKVVIFPADNGFKTVVPLYNFFNRFFKKKLYFVVIGGFLPALLQKKPQYIKKLKKYEAMFVQTENLKQDLEVFGFSNIHILSNLKRLNTIKRKDIVVREEKEIKVCTLSRIVENKGIDYAVEAVKKANEKLGGKYIHLDIFGIVAEPYREHFEKLMADNGDFATYGGVLEFDHTTETLQNYFAMLFPTFFYGEGFPGNVVDAYNAGVPIIATDWLYNKDVIKDGQNGILVPIKDSDAVCGALLELYNDRELQHRLALNNVEEAEKYVPDKVLAEFYSFMER